MALNRFGAEYDQDMPIASGATMSSPQSDMSQEPRRRGRHTPLFAGLVTLGMMGLFWYLAIGGMAALLDGFGWRQGLLLGGGLVVVTAFLAEFRISGADTMFEWIADIGAMILSAIAALVSFILGLFGFSPGE